MISPRKVKSDRRWSDAKNLPSVYGKQIEEPYTHVRETGFLRQNIPSPWNTKISAKFDYGTISEPERRYALLEKEPGENAWEDNIVNLTDQLVTQQPELDSYSFESPIYSQAPVRQAQVFHEKASSPKAVNRYDDDIDVSDLGFLMEDSDFVLPSNSSIAPGVGDPYNFDAPQYAYRAEDNVNNWVFQPSSRVANVSSHQPLHNQLEIDFNNPLTNDNSPLTDYGKLHIASLSPLERFKLGLREGNSFGVGEDYSQANFDPAGKAYYSKSVVFDRAPKSRYAHLDSIGQVGFGFGRVASDIYGNGTRKYLWNLQPEDFTNTEGKRLMNEAGASRTTQLALPYLATLALGVGSGNYNPFNINEGGRPEGFSAINSGDDPRNSTSPLYDLAIERGMLGRRGRLLPWEQFHQERPEISFEQYDKYNSYLTNKDENVLRKATGGLVKGTIDGINGPEINVMGYSVNPIGAASAIGIIALGRKAVLQK